MTFFLRLALPDACKSYLISCGTIAGVWLQDYQMVRLHKQNPSVLLHPARRAEHNLTPGNFCYWSELVMFNREDHGCTQECPCPVGAHFVFFLCLCPVRGILMDRCVSTCLVSFLLHSGNRTLTFLWGCTMFYFYHLSESIQHCRCGKWV